MNKVVLSTAALLCGALVMAQENRSQIEQYNDDHVALVTQVGELNRSSVYQNYGDGSTSIISQGGT